MFPDPEQFRQIAEQRHRDDLVFAAERRAWRRLTRHGRAHRRRQGST